MKKTLILCLLAFCFASAAKKELAIFNCTGNYDYDGRQELRKRLQEIVREELPSNDYTIVPYDAVKKKLTEKKGGDEEKADKAINKAECSASGVCYREVLKEIEVDYGAGCDVSQNSEGKWVFSFSLEDKSGLLKSKSYDKGNPKKVNDFIEIMNREIPKVLREAFFGVLEVRPAYQNGIGKKEGDWILYVNNVKKGSSYVNNLSPGSYDIKLSHKCYEDINDSVEISKGRTELFDVAKYLNLKTGRLVLNATLNGKPAEGEFVFVDGNQVGKTPFESTDPIPLCSEINIGRKREKVAAELRPNETVKHIHEMSLVQKSSTFIAIGLDVLGAAAIGYAIYQNNETKNAFDSYSARGRTADYYEDAWEKAKSSKSKRDMAYIVGGALLASGIGVHIWF